MKFLCDNCKAKYQIADDKVAGKTVRMKCRKCGHQIEVRAAVTETSVSTAPPKPDAPPAPQKPAAPRQSTLATSLSATKPRAHQSQPGVTGSALAGAFQRNVQDSPASVGSPSVTNDRVELSVTDEWYVAINGVPVGPVRISELRRKAAAGAVTEDSLCWQEGLEEWRPVRAVPELAAIVREAAQGNRPSLIAPAPDEKQGRTSAPPPPAAARPPARPVPPRAAPSAEVGAMPGPPRPPVPAPPRSNVVPLRPAAQLEDSAPALGSMGGAAPMLAPTFQPLPAPPPPAPSVAADPFALPPTPAPSAPLMPAATAPLAPPLGGGLASPATSSSAIAPLGISGSASLAPPPPSAYLAPKKSGVPVWFWLIAVFVLGFGGAAALFFVTRQPPQQIVVQVPVPAATPQPTNQGDIPPPTASAETPAAPTATATGKAPTSKGGAVAAATPEKKGGAADVSGLLDGKGSGPGIPSPGGPGPSGGGGTMDQAAVERVVASHRQGVKRTCWERGNADQKPATSVTVNATVGPDGRVQSASSTGDDPAVAKCIENQVKSWQFPASGSTTPIQIPFKFVRQ